MLFLLLLFCIFIIMFILHAKEFHFIAYVVLKFVILFWVTQGKEMLLKGHDDGSGTSGPNLKIQKETNAWGFFFLKTGT